MKRKTTKIDRRLHFWGRETQALVIQRRLAHLAYLSSFEAGRGGHDAIARFDTRPAISGESR